MGVNTAVVWHGIDLLNEVSIVCRRRVTLRGIPAEGVDVAVCFLLFFSSENVLCVQHVFCSLFLWRVGGSVQMK